MAEKVVCVVGPTACGKTELGVELAKALNGEVVSVDSMQIYRGMTIGTAAPTPEEMDGVPHHMVAVADPEEQWSVARYTQAATACVEDILARGRRVVLVGGTGLWLDALISGQTFAPGQSGGEIRRELEQQFEREGIQGLWAELEQVDPESAGKLHMADTKRILRALEVYRDGQDHLRPQRRDGGAAPAVRPGEDRPGLPGPGGHEGPHRPAGGQDGGRGPFGGGAGAAAPGPASDRHRPPGHRLQGVFGGPGRHRHPGPGH